MVFFSTSELCDASVLLSVVFVSETEECSSVVLFVEESRDSSFVLEVELSLSEVFSSVTVDVSSVELVVVSDVA